MAGVPPMKNEVQVATCLPFSRYTLFKFSLDFRRGLLRTEPPQTPGDSSHMRVNGEGRHPEFKCQNASRSLWTYTGQAFEVIPDLSGFPVSKSVKPVKTEI